MSLISFSLAPFNLCISAGDWAKYKNCKMKEMICSSNTEKKIFGLFFVLTAERLIEGKAALFVLETQNMQGT